MPTNVAAAPRSLAVLIVVAAAVILLAMGRNPICTCGTVDLWVGRATAPRPARCWPTGTASATSSRPAVLRGAVAGRAALAGRMAFPRGAARSKRWEVIENTPIVIDRYRETTAALGYTATASSIRCPTSHDGVGFLLARKLPVWAAVDLLVVLEVVPLFVIRDNLTLNIWNLLAPNPAVAAWQAGH